MAQKKAEARKSAYAIGNSDCRIGKILTFPRKMHFFLAANPNHRTFALHIAK